MKAEKVFTPKGEAVNEDMYIHRRELENHLTKAIRKPKHIVIHGESGSGKTWLYKKIFKEVGIYYEVLNSATINSTGSISAAIEALVSRINPTEKTGYEEKMQGEINAVFAKGQLENTNKYILKSLEPFLELSKILASKAKRRQIFLVIENLEHIVKSSQHVKELSSLLLYLDDEAYAKYNVRILLVGTPSNLRDYFSEADDSQTIINRLQEIPEISTLTKSQVDMLVKKGMFDYLKINVISDKQSGFSEVHFLNAISWFSANIPQYIHEFCLEVAMEAETIGMTITYESYINSLRNWVKEALVSENSRLEKHINSKGTRHGRRNQVIYTIGALNDNEFNINEVEERLRKLFPKSTNGKTLNISSNLSVLSSGSHPIIRRTPKGTRYRFLDPKIKIMARWMLNRNDNETISVKTFDDTIKL